MAAERSARGSGRYGRIGKYDILAHVATGGMCVVYKALDTDLGREVALKILPPELAVHSPLLERFRREARHVARLRHDNIVSIYEFGEANGTHFLALEFVDGIDLHEYIIRQGPLNPDDSCHLLTQAARALDHLHRFHMVHRDVKPANFLLTGKQHPPLVKLTDLGLARVSREEEFRVTKAGHTVGTIDFMAPEQARDSGQADIRSDLYSLGCTWYYTLAGRPPFGEGGLAERLYQHLCVEPPDIRKFNAQVGPELVSVLRQLLAKQPSDRFQTPAELLQSLGRLKNSGAAPPPREPSRAANRPPVPRSEAHTVHSGHDRDTSSDVDVADAESPAALCTP
jgi:serine/threonine-protein kinase